MMRIAFALVALVLSAGLARAQTASVQGIQIVSYGIYTAEPSGAQPDANGSFYNTVDNIRLAASTQIVPLQLGVKFGLQYKVVGAPPGTPVKLKEVVVYPPVGAHPPGKEALASVAVEPTVKIGTDTRSDFYGLDDAWELIPGTWTFQVWSGDRKLAEQTFTVVAP